MKVLILALALTACAPEPLPPTPPGDCPTDARLPYPPIPARRTIAVLISWANTAATAANRALAERDVCAASYQRLKEWAAAVQRDR